MSNVLVPVSDFAALVTRLEALEAKVAERLVDGVYRYGPCLRCGYGPWDSSSSHEPRCCPRCHSAYWNTPPKRSFARTPEDPPLPRWDPKRRVKVRKQARVVPPVVEDEAPTRPAIVLPPELRPPGEPLIPLPPRAPVTLPDVTAQRTTENPMNARPVHVVDLEMPVAAGVHVAVLPDAVVEAILDGQPVTYEEIKAAKERGDATRETTGPETNHAEAAGDSQVRADDVRHAGPSRPIDANLQAKKDAFFADAIAAGLVATEPEGEADADATPFVNEADAPSLAPNPGDDPFWK